MEQGKKVIVRQVRSGTGRNPQTRATLKALGLGRIGGEREHSINPAVAGMIAAVRHLVTVTPAK